MVMVNVRGIGVAVMTSTSGAGFRELNRARCATPNLCCSSITTRPRFSNETLSYSKACVPITICGLSAEIWGAHACSVLVVAFCGDELLTLCISSCGVQIHG